MSRRARTFQSSVKERKKTLQAFVMGRHLRLAAKTGGQFRQVDATHLDQSQQKVGQKTQACAMPVQMLCQGGFEVLLRIVHDFDRS